MRMTIKTAMGVFAAGALSLGLASAAMAEAGPIEARKGCMKANAKMMKVMVPVMKGEQAYDKAAFDAAIAETEAACAGWGEWWGEDTKPGGAVETEATEAVWTNKAGFEAAGAAYVKAMEGVKASADEASFKAAFPELGKACQSCHETFRKPKS